MNVVGDLTCTGVLISDSININSSTITSIGTITITNYTQTGSVTNNIYLISSTITADSLIFNQNSTTIFFDQGTPYTNVLANNVLFRNNIQSVSGSHAVVVYNTNLFSNSAARTAIKFNNNMGTSTSTNYGVVLRYINLLADTIEFNYNSSSGGGSGVYLGPSTTVTSNRTVFNNNSSSSNYGVIFDSGSTNINSGSVEFTNNSTTSGSGGVHLTDSNNVIQTDLLKVITNCSSNNQTFVNNGGTSNIQALTGPSSSYPSTVLIYNTSCSNVGLPPASSSGSAGATGATGATGTAYVVGAFSTGATGTINSPVVATTSYTVTAGLTTIEGGLVVDGPLTISGGSLVIDGELVVKGNVTIASGSTLTVRGDVTFDGLSAANTTTPVSIAGSITISGDFYCQNYASSATSTISITGTLSAANAYFYIKIKYPCNFFG